MALFHQSDRLFEVGAVVEPGRWGSTVLQAGQAHHHFFRELFLELWRISQTDVAVSRLECAFAFEDRHAAIGWASGSQSHCYEVEPIEHSAPSARVDMLWLTWMGEPQATFERTVSQCRSYWKGQSTAAAASHANPVWEWLFGCGLRVIGSDLT
jgi:hypothetical protein